MTGTRCALTGGQPPRSMADAARGRFGFAVPVAPDSVGLFVRSQQVQRRLWDSPLEGLSRQGRVSSLWDDVAAALSECLVCGLSASFQPEDYSLILPTDALEQKGQVNPQSGYGAKKSRGCVCQGKHGHLKVSLCLFIFCFCL